MYHDARLYSIQKKDALRSVRVIGWDTRPDGTNMLLKRRDCAVIHYVLQGEGFFDGIRVRAGQGFYFPANELHTYKADPSNPWGYVFLDLAQEFADQYVVSVLNADENGIFTFSFVEQLQRWAERIFSGRDETMISQIDAIYHAASILRRHGAADDEGSGKQEFYIQRAKMFIESNLNRRLTVVEVARQVNLNERYLCALFVKYENLSTKDYISSRRIQIACDLLSGSTLSIKEIALSTGFPDSNSFSKSFKLKTGLSPKEYRELNTK